MADDLPKPSPQPVLPLLTYATPGDETLPDEIPAAEKLISQGKGVAAIASFFRSPQEATLYFARSWSHRYSRRGVPSGRPCVVCGCEAQEWLNVSWGVQLSGYRFGLERTFNSSCETAHPICRRCHQETTTPWRWSTFMPFFAVAAWLPFVVAMLTVFLVSSKWLSRRYDFGDATCPAFIFALLGTSIALVLWRFARRFEVPVAICELEQPGLSVRQIWPHEIAETVDGL